MSEQILTKTCNISISAIIRTTDEEIKIGDKVILSDSGRFYLLKDHSYFEGDILRYFTITRFVKEKLSIFNFFRKREILEVVMNHESVTSAWYRLYDEDNEED